MKLLLIGATGLVGRHVLAQALIHPAVDAVVTPVRRVSTSHPKQTAPVVDFDALPEDAAWWRADAIVCTLGTTMRVAGSAQAFYRVDHDYPLAVATRARAHGTPTCVLNSAMGADVASRFFYNRVKGEVERDIALLGFPSLTLVRPGLIGGQRDEIRRGERIAQAVLGTLRPLLPQRWRINPAERIARSILDAAIASQPGTRIVSSDQLT